MNVAYPGTVLTVRALRLGGDAHKAVHKRMNAGSPPPRHQIAQRLNQACCNGPRAMRMGAAMMRFGSNLYLTSAGIGLMMVTLLLVGAIVVRVMTVSEHGEIRAHTTSENGNRVTLDIGVADLRGSLP